jgi:hypothetical protein
MMPAASVDGAPWQLESAEILQQVGYQPISSEDLIAIYDAWQGIIQCHCSIPVPPIAALQEDPRLGRMRSWIGTMQQRFAGYGRLYSGVYFEPHAPAPTPTTRVEQAAFWMGSIFMLVSFPITVPLILYFAVRVPRTRES